MRLLERVDILENTTDNLLQQLLASSTIESVEVALHKAMKQKEIKDFSIKQMGTPPKFERKKKGDKYQEQYRYSIRIDGRQISFTGKTEEIIYQKVWDYFHTGKAPSKKNATLKEVFIEYYEVRKRDKSKTSETVRMDKITWNRFFNNHKFANTPIKDISVLDLKEFFGDITQKGLLKRKAVDKPRSLLKAIYDYAIPNYCEHNIVNEINLGNYHYDMSENNDIYTDEEVVILLEHIRSCPQWVYSLAIRLMFCFNMRIGELRALTWNDVDLENRVVKIWHQMSKQEVNGVQTYVDVPYTKGNKKTGIRMLPISDEAIKILEELKTINGDKPYVLQATNGAKLPIATDKFNKHLKRYCEECGVTYRSSHKIRFLGITKLFEAGVDEVTIQKSAGHSNIEMTRHYNRDRRDLQVDRNVWNNLFS